MYVSIHITLFIYWICFVHLLFGFNFQSYFFNSRNSQENSLSKDKIPLKRKFYPLKPLSFIQSQKIYVHSTLRLLQFNILADGLSGLRDDFGAFSRVKFEDIEWSNRKNRLLAEITQYDPDVITLQEVDHYYDFFLPQLSMLGYDGFYAPKPASACLEVSSNADGCCIFVKRKKLKVFSSETLTFALSRADVAGSSDSITEDDRQIRVQNQVGLVTVCEILDGPLIIIATTHLKASKTLVGERYRFREVTQLLEAIERVAKSLEFTKGTPAIILTGDLNASPTNSTTGYEALAYSSVKSHSLNLRSVLNDDTPVDASGTIGKAYYYGLYNNSSLQIWTTWKSRLSKGVEKIAKHCIDYIMYQPPSDARVVSEKNIQKKNIGIIAKNVLDLFADDEISQELLPNAIYPSDHLAIAADLQIVELLD